MSPMFSIVTVCRNAVETIGVSAQSLREQGFRDYEWLVIDGASSDRTLEEVKAARIANTRVNSEPDGGIYDAMNKSLHLARGEFIFFLNADDRFHDPDVLRDVAEQLRRSPQVDFLLGDVAIEKSGSSIRKSHWYINRRTILYEDVCHQSVFVRRALFSQVGPFVLNWRTSADYDWFVRVYLSGACVRYWPRMIAFFKAGGMHANNLDALGRERETIRLQYCSTLQLKLGMFLSQAAHRVSRQLFGGLRIGESIMD